MTQASQRSDVLPIDREPSAARHRRSLRSRVSSGHLVMVVAGVLGLLLSLSVLRRADDTVPVVVVTRDVVAGSRIQADMIGTTRIHADPRLLATLFSATRAESLRGSIVVASLHTGDLLPRSVLASASTHRATRAVSFPVDSALAVGGELSAGDRIDVLASAHDGSSSGYVLVAADVIAVHSAATGPLHGGDGQLSITVAVDAAGAQRLAGALHAADLLVVRSTGAPAVAPVHWYAAGHTNG